MQQKQLRELYYFVFPVGLVVSGGIIGFLPSPTRGSGLILSYSIAFIIQLGFLLAFLQGRAWHESLYGKIAGGINLLGCIATLTGIVSYSIHGEVFGINLDLYFAPRIALFLSLALGVGLLWRRRRTRRTR